MFAYGTWFSVLFCLSIEISCKIDRHMGKKFMIGKTMCGEESSASLASNSLESRLGFAISLQYLHQAASEMRG